MKHLHDMNLLVFIDRCFYSSHKKLFVILMLEGLAGKSYLYMESYIHHSYSAHVLSHMICRSFLLYFCYERI